jgi:hypothetical protein
MSGEGSGAPPPSAVSDATRTADIKRANGARKAQQDAEKAQAEQRKNPPTPAPTSEPAKPVTRVDASVSRKGGLTVTVTKGPVTVTASKSGVSAKPTPKDTKPVEPVAETQIMTRNPLKPGEGGAGMNRVINETNANAEKIPWYRFEFFAFLGFGKRKYEKKIETGPELPGDATTGKVTTQAGKSTSVAGAGVKVELNPKNLAEKVVSTTAGEITRGVINLDMIKRSDAKAQERRLERLMEEAENGK